MNFLNSNRFVALEREGDGGLPAGVTRTVGGVLNLNNPVTNPNQIARVTQLTGRGAQGGLGGQRIEDVRF